MSSPDQPPPPPSDYQPIYRGRKESIAGRSLVVPGRKTTVAGQEVALASPWRRLGARVIDLVLVTAVYFLVTWPILGYDWDESDIGLYLVAAAVGAAIEIAYEVTLIATRGQTLGKMAARIKVIRVGDGQLPGWSSSLRRWAIPGLTRFIPNLWAGTLAAWLCYLSLTWGRNHRGWHDMVAGTIVVRERPSTSSPKSASIPPS